MQDNLPTSLRTKKNWISYIPVSFRGLLAAVAFVWVIEFIDLFPNIGLDQFGVRPRNLIGLIGIPLMPFLHGDFTHLASNTIPFLILGWIVLKAEKKKFIIATTAIILLGGLGTWIIGRAGSLHVGASGLVYGYFGYVMIRAILERNLKWIITGLFVGLFYGSLIMGILPINQPQISWEGHLCGMAAGIWIGWIRSRKNKRALQAPPSSSSIKLPDQYL